MDNQEQTTELPLVALIGPTNAGKSTLFNRMTGSHQAITAREESTTRDRVYGEVEWQGELFTVVDTGGLVDDESELYKSIKEQMLSAVEEADLILFVYDARAGLQPKDQQFLDTLRGKQIFLVANKVDAPQVDKSVKDLEFLGFPFHKISAATGKGVGDLLEEVVKILPEPIISTEPLEKLPIIALVGRPNVGKSTLLNGLTKSDRAVVSPVAGTTRDVVTAELELDGKRYLLADTAGVRRRGKIGVGIEQFSVKRTIAAINHADAVLVLVNATEGTTRADLHLIYYAQGQKKPVLVVFNKTDLLDEGQPLIFHHHIAKFEQTAISAKEGKNVASVLNWIKKQF